MAALTFSELENSNSTPIDQINSKEFIEGLLKAGSFISMCENKKINTTTLFSLLFESNNYRDFFTEITASENFKNSILSLLYLNPSLVKSKITKTIIRKLNAKSRQIDRSRKIVIQQTPCHIKERKKQAIQN